MVLKDILNLLLFFFFWGWKIARTWNNGLCFRVQNQIYLEQNHNYTYDSFSDGSALKNLLETQETQETHIQSLDQEDLLEEEMATHSSILAWKIPWTEKPGGLQFKGSQKSQTWLSMHTHNHICSSCDKDAASIRYATSQDPHQQEFDSKNHLH